MALPHRNAQHLLGLGDVPSLEDDMASEARPATDDLVSKAGDPDLTIKIIGANAAPETGYKSLKQDNTGHNAERNDPHCILPTSEKRLLMLLASFAGMLSPFSSSTYYPAVDALAVDLKVTVTLINLTISTYLIFQGVAPSFAAAVSETYGRRPAYLFCFVVYISANIGLAVQDSYTALLVLRCLQSAGSSGTVALAAGTVNDLFTRAERGQALGLVAMGTVLGPTLGPVFGGLLSQYLGWRAIFRFLLILGSSIGVLMGAFYRETSRCIVGNGSVPPAKWNRSLVQVLQEDIRKRPASPPNVETLGKRKDRIDLLTSIRVLREQENAFIIVYVGVLWAGYVSVVSILSSQIRSHYGLDQVHTGLCYLPLGLGSLASRFSMSYLIDWNFRREAKRQGLEIVKNRQQDITNFDTEKARLTVGMPMVLGACCCLVTYGWTMQYRVPLAAVLVTLFFVGNTSTGSFVAVSALMSDINQDSIASAAAAANLVRCLLGAGAVALANPFIKTIGIGWTSIIVAFIRIAISPSMWLVYKNGHQWRTARAVRLQRSTV